MADKNNGEQMDSIWGWALSGLLLGVVFLGIERVVRRARGIKDTARELGLEYKPHDHELAKDLTGVVPMFTLSEILVSDVASNRTLFGQRYLFRYSYVERNAAGRPDRESVGLAACLKSNAGDIGKLIGETIPEHINERWHIEHGGEWLAMRRKSDRGSDGYSGHQLREYHEDVQQLLIALLGPTD